jgi:hypothetical protein
MAYDTGDEECLFQEKRPRLMLNTFDDSFVISVDGQSLEEEEHDFSRSAFGSGLQDHTMADCSTSGGDLEDSLMLRDFPHPRHVCVVFPFIPSPCVSNSSHCNKVSIPSHHRCVVEYPVHWPRILRRHCAIGATAFAHSSHV